MTGRMVELGCEIGNHSWDHLDMLNLSIEDVVKEFGDTDQALIDACETVYCPCMEFGVCNSYNQELYFYAKKQNKLKNLSE